MAVPSLAILFAPLRVCEGTRSARQCCAEIVLVLHDRFCVVILWVFGPCHPDPIEADLFEFLIAVSKPTYVILVFVRGNEEVQVIFRRRADVRDDVIQFHARCLGSQRTTVD